jgi:hypothetical protein
MLIWRGAMTVRVFVLLLLAFSAVGVRARVAAVDITGTWAVTVRIQNQDFPSTFVFTQDGETLTGSYAGPLGPANVTGTVKADAVTFSFTGRNNSGEPVTVDYSGKIASPTKMSGTVDFHKGPPAEWSATKKTAKP